MAIRYLEQIFSYDQISIDPILVYGIDPVVGGKALCLTSYYVKPGIDTEKEKCVFVFLHGGGGSRDDGPAVSYCKYFTTLGYAALAIDYPEDQTQAIQAVWTLRQWLYLNERQGHINPSKVFVMGASLGGIVSLESSIASWVNNTPANKLWPLNPNNKLFPITVLATATISGAATGVYETAIPSMKSPNAFYSGIKDTTVPYKKQVENFEMMIASRVPHMNEPLWAQQSFDTGHVIGHFDEISASVRDQFYSLIKSTSL